jgi:hypothetical protein
MSNASFGSTDSDILVSDGSSARALLQHQRSRSFKNITGDKLIWTKRLHSFSLEEVAVLAAKQDSLEFSSGLSGDIHKEPSFGLRDLREENGRNSC